MTAPRDLAQQMAEKSAQELQEMFASPDDWTAEALDAAKTELRNRGLDRPAEAAPESVARPGRRDAYEYFGTYSNEDARRLLEAFVSSDIDYTLNVDQMGIADMSAFQAADGGTFGAGVGLKIGVHADDCDKAMEIRQRVLKIIL